MNNNNQKIILNAMDFLIMAQNGTLKVMVDDKGNVLGVNVADELVTQYDGILVALSHYSELMSKTSYTLIKRPSELPPIEMIVGESTEEENDNNEE